MMSDLMVERLVRFAAAPMVLKRIGPAAPLLSTVTILCDRDDSCIVNLTELSEQLDVPHSTIKSWLRKLVALGLVESLPQGRNGCRIELRANRLPDAPEFSDARRKVQYARELLSSLRTVVDDAVDGSLQKLEATQSAE